MRKIYKVCQDCWAEIRPGDYFPVIISADDCASCGQLAFVARVTRAEVEKHVKEASTDKGL